MQVDPRLAFNKGTLCANLGSKACASSLRCIRLTSPLVAAEAIVSRAQSLLAQYKEMQVREPQSTCAPAPNRINSCQRSSAAVPTCLTPPCVLRGQVPQDRVLIRIPATWEGIQAAEQLEKMGIACHMILVYR